MLVANKSKRILLKRTKASRFWRGVRCAEMSEIIVGGLAGKDIGAEAIIEGDSYGGEHSAEFVAGGADEREEALRLDVAWGLGKDEYAGRGWAGTGNYRPEGHFDTPALLKAVHRDLGQKIDDQWDMARTPAWRSESLRE